MKDNYFLGTFVPKVEKITAKCVEWLSICLLVMIFIVGLAQVIWRWGLNNPIVWSEELIRLTYIWICYLGWVIAERRDSHIRITAILNALPKRYQKWIQAANHVIVIVFSIFMVIYGTKLIGAGMKRTAVSFPLNFGFVYLMCPICNFIIIFYEIAVLIECLTKGPRDYREKGGGEE